MSPRATAGDHLRRALPQALHLRLYALHPGRAARWRRHPGIERVPPSGAVLTFDDGPDPEGTPAVLDELERCGARATFFLLGCRALAEGQLAIEIVRRGHEVGLHGFDHRRQDRIEAAASHEDLRRGLAAIEDTVGVRCRFYRPPYGKMSPGAADACRQLGLDVVYWSAWGFDWEALDAQQIAATVAAGMVDGAVVLLHDSARYGRRASARATAAAIPLIAATAAQRHLALTCLGEALGRQRTAPARADRASTTIGDPSA
jgi:peptidoglycan/xylan/chitin deacetylase (PgdA/CDA1 family)